MADQPSHVVRIPRSDEEGQNAPCSPDEWEQILSFLLLGNGSVDNIDATATVKEEETLTITVRKRVQNITQRLGTLSLTYDGDEGIELFEWCGEAVEEQTRAASALVKATAEQSSLQATVGELTAQLDEFLEAKAADEAAMLEKFCMLLNEKKVKIRQQQLQLRQAAEEDAASAQRAEVEAEIKEEEDIEEEEPAPAPAPPTRGRRGGARAGRLGKVGRGGSTAAASATARRGAKRRAATAVSDADDSDDGEFEKPTSSGTKGSARQKAQKAKGAEGEAAADEDSGTESEEDDRTTEHDDGSTESEDEPEPMEEDAPVKQEELSQRPKAAPVPDEAPPPRRTLAFGKARGSASGSAAPPAPAPVTSSSKDHDMDGSDSESDDEL
ncbi:hypothetical protein SCUCBS95973_007685 [Sporothrix curviconia]|uniref:XRCC4 coiled-coil domain-containing protein n=1 Tax=Sporothrix curviconia TaxID=1260050 RepID=A0ABP0CFA6_9PEZI